jgi:hypothetical protein
VRRAALPVRALPRRARPRVALLGTALVLAACSGPARLATGEPAYRTVPPSSAGSTTSTPTTSPSSKPGPTPGQTRPTPGYEEGPRPKGLPLASLRVRSTSGYRFDALQDDKKTAVAWSPCRPVHYVVRTKNQPAWGAAALRSAFAEVHKATGLTFVYDGTTTEATRTLKNLYQPKRYGDRWAPVVISWTKPGETKILRGSVAGVTNVYWWQVGTEPAALVSGMVQLDAPDLSRIARVAGTTEARGVILHELGHLVGLGHVKDKRQNMFPVISSRNVHYASGDRAGLTLLGEGPCAPHL